MRKTISRISSVVMSVMLVAGSLGGGPFEPVTALAGETVQENSLISDDKLTEYFNAVTENTVTVHDPSIIIGEDKDGKKCYFIFGSHMAWAKSYDLENWVPFTNNVNAENLRNILPAEIIDWSAKGGNQGSASGVYEPSGNMWAPDIIYNEELGKWCMYMSVNGDNYYTSVVLLTADNLEGDWTYVDSVVYSGFTSAEDAALTDWAEATGQEFDAAAVERYTRKRNRTLIYGMNAIDPCVFYDEGGRLLMSYGSWFGGIYMIELDKSTGLRDYTVKYALESNVSDPYMGIKIAGGNGSTGEASYIQYIDGYYYLFMSYGGFVANGGYNMRIFRSKDATGPYVDMQGRSARYSDSDKVAAANTGNGTRLMTYYKWSWWKNAQVAQGHNSAFTDEDGKSYVIYHTRTDDGTEGHYVRVHQLFTTENGYLTAAPFEYKNTDSTEVAKADIAGTYEVIMHTNTNHSAVESVTSKEMTLNGDGTISGAYSGTWSSKTVDGKENINLVINNVTYEGVMLNQTMEGTDVKTLCFTAVGKDVAFWGAKQPEDAVAVAATAVYKNTREDLPQVALGPIEMNSNGYFGAAVSWSSDNEAVIAADGTYNQPEKDTDVTLTMTATKGDYVYKRSYVVKAKAALDTTDDRFLVAEYLTGEEADLSDGSIYNFRNAFNSKVTPGLDISGGVSVKFDTELKDSTPSALSNLLAFTGGGRLYFTGGSYLGYNVDGTYFDANLKDYRIVTDYIGTYNKVTVEIKLTSEGFAVYVNDKLAYTNDSLAAGTYAGTLTDFGEVLDWLGSTADTISLGTGNWWPDAVYKGTVSNIKLYAQPVEKEQADTSLYEYYEDYDGLTDSDILAAWPAINLAGAVAKDNAHGKYFSYVHPGSPTNTRGIISMLPAEAYKGEGYSIAVDVQLKAGNNQGSEFAIVSSDKAYNGNNANNGLASGYLVHLKAGANTTKWTVNGNGSVDIPADTWVNIQADILAGGKVKITIKNGDTVIYTGEESYNGNGVIQGIYLLDGRYLSAMAVDNIKVWDSSIDPDNKGDVEYEQIITTTTEDKTESKEYGKLIDGAAGWNTAGSDIYTLKGEFDSTVIFKNIPFIRGTNNWFNFVFETVGTDAAKGITLRADAYGWTYGDKGQVPEHTSVLYPNADSFWAGFADANKGIVYLNAKKTGANTVDFTITYGNNKDLKLVYTVTYPSGVPAELQFKVGADGGKIYVLKYVNNNGAEGTANTEYGQVIDGSAGWDNSVKDDYTLTGEFDATVTFDNTPFVKDTNVYSNYLIETVASEAAKGLTLRADKWGWTYGDTGQEPAFSWAEYPDAESFSAGFAEAHKGIVYVNAKKTGENTVEFTTTYDNNKALKRVCTVTYPNGVPEKLSFHLRGEGGKLSVWSYENNYTITTETVELVEKKSVSVHIAPVSQMSTVDEGYSTAPVAEYTIKNVGAKAATNLKVALGSGSSFELVNTSGVTELAVGESITVKVAAKSGLKAAAADYTDKLIVTADGMTDAQKVKISLGVLAAAEEGVKNPEPKDPEEETSEKETEEQTSDKETEEQTSEKETEEETSEKETEEQTSEKETEKETEQSSEDESNSNSETESTGETETVKPSEEDTEKPSGDDSSEESTQPSGDSNTNIANDGKVVIYSDTSISVSYDDSKCGLNISANADIYDKDGGRIAIDKDSSVVFIRERVKDKTEIHKQVTEIIKDILLEKEEKIKEAVVMDIKVEVNNVAVKSLVGKMEVTMPIPEELKAAKHIIVYRQEDDGTLTGLGDARLKKDTLTFTTDHFSVYVFVEKEPIVDVTDKDNNIVGEPPQTGDYIKKPKQLWLMALLMSAIVAALSIKKRTVR